MELLSDKLKNSRKISVAIASEGNLDMFFGAFALRESLLNSGKNVDCEFPHNKLIKAKLKTLGYKIQPPLPIINYEIDLDRKQLGIKTAKLEETETGYKIQFETSDPLTSKPVINIGNILQKADLLIQLGDYQAELEPNQIHKDSIILINYESADPELANLFWQVKTASFCESIYKLLKTNGFSVKGNIASALLAGMLWKSDSLTVVSSPTTFEIINKLLAAGGDYALAVRLGLNNQTFLRSKSYGETFSKLTAAGNGIFYAIVDVPENNETAYLRNYVPISEIYNCKLAFVIEKGQAKCQIYLRSNTLDIDLKAVCNEFGGTASDFEGYFSSIEPAEQVALNLIKKLEAKMKIEDQPKHEPAVNNKEETKAVEQASVSEPIVKPESKVEQPLAFDPLAPAKEIPQPMVINNQTGKLETKPI